MAQLNAEIGMLEIVLVEGHEAFRQSLEFFLNFTGRHRCRSYGSGREAIEGMVGHRPLVMVTDIHLPGGMDGITCTRVVKDRWPDVQVLMCTEEEDDDKIFNALRAGASGYLHKRSGLDEISDAIRQVVLGGSPMSPSIARRVVNSFRPAKLTEGPDALSEREQEVLDMLCKGLRPKSIGERLYVSANTVRTHIRHIYEKLHVRSRVEAVNRVRGKG